MLTKVITAAKYVRRAQSQNHLDKNLALMQVKSQSIGSLDELKINFSIY